MSDSRSTRLYAVALFGVVLYFVLDVVAQSLPPHYSPLSQAESDLAVGPFGYVMTINFLNRGLLSFAFLFAFLGSVRLAGADASRFRAGVYLFGAWSAGAVLLALFPTDVPATPVSWHGAIHIVVAVLAFLGGAFGALTLSLRMRGVEAFEGVGRYAVPLALLSVVLCVADLLGGSVVPRFDSHFGGLLERLFLGSVLLWVSVVSAYEVAHANPRAPTAPPS